MHGENAKNNILEKVDYSHKFFKLKQQHTEEKLLCKFYEPALIALACCGIDMFPNSYSSYRYQRKVMFIVNIFLTLANFILLIKMIANINTDNSLFAIVIQGSIFKYMLFKKRKEIFNFIKESDENKFRIECIPYIFNFRKKFFYLIISVLLSLTMWCIIAPEDLNEYVIQEEITLCSILQKYNVSVSEKAVNLESALNFIVPFLFGFYTLEIFLFCTLG